MYAIQPYYLHQQAKTVPPITLPFGVVFSSGFAFADDGFGNLLNCDVTKLVDFFLSA